jgi:Flp pilus assembly protein TadD
VESSTEALMQPVELRTETSADEELEEQVARAQALADARDSRAETACLDALRRCPLSIKLHYLHASLLLEQGRDEEALAALGKVIYLDRNNAAAHFRLGSVLARRGNYSAARRAFARVHELCAGQPANDRVPLAPEDTWVQLQRAADDQLARLELVVS